MAKCALYLVTYDRGKHPITDRVNHYHWLYFIQINIKGEKNLGITHQLRGMPGGFYYPGPEDEGISKFGPAKNQLEVGELEESKLDRIHEILKAVQIDTVETSGWNCQDWALEGLEKLKEEGYIYGYLTREAVKNWLKET